MNLINSDKLWESANFFGGYKINGESYVSTKEVDNWVHAQPVINVTFCNECRYRGCYTNKDINRNVFYCTLFFQNKEHLPMIDTPIGTCFCSMGAPKEDENGH